MRSTEKILAMIAAVLGLAISAKADTQEIDGITWTYIVENGEASVGIGGDSIMTSTSAVPGTTTGAIVIPSTLGGYPVTGISAFAFSHLEITSVTIPDGVTSIGNYAFFNCSELTNVTIPNSVTSVGKEAFGECDALLSKLYLAFLKGNMGGDSRYDISNSVGDRVVASVMVSANMALEDFVLPSGKVYDSVVYITNTASTNVDVSMPDGHLYKTLKWMRPLTIPANSSNILTITRIADNTFLLSRQELETVQ